MYGTGNGNWHMRVEIGSELRNRVSLTLQSAHTLACVPNHIGASHKHTIRLTLH